VPELMPQHAFQNSKLVARLTSIIPTSVLAPSIIPSMIEDKGGCLASKN